MAQTEDPLPTARILALSSLRKRHVFNPAIRQLFQIYDADGSKTMDAGEVRTMMLDCINNEDKVLTPDEAINFLRVILGEASDELEDEELQVTEDQFTLFMLNGMVKEKADLKEFSQRSIVHRKLYLFIKHMLDQKANLEEAAYRNTKDAYNTILSNLFDRHANEAGTLDAVAMKTMIGFSVNTMTRRVNEKNYNEATIVAPFMLPTTEDMDTLMGSLDQDGTGQLDKDTFVNFIVQSLSQTEEKRAKYSKRSSLHQKLYFFLSSVMLKQIQDGIDLQRENAAKEIQKTWNIYRDNKKAKTFMALMTQAKEFSFEDLLAAAADGDDGDNAEEDNGVTAAPVGGTQNRQNNSATASTASVTSSATMPLSSPVDEVTSTPLSPTSALGQQIFDAPPEDSEEFFQNIDLSSNLEVKSWGASTTNNNNSSSSTRSSTNQAPAAAKNSTSNLEAFVPDGDEEGDQLFSGNNSAFVDEGDEGDENQDGIQDLTDVEVAEFMKAEKERLNALVIHNRVISDDEDDEEDLFEEQGFVQDPEDNEVYQMDDGDDELIDVAPDKKAADLNDGLTPEERETAHTFVWNYVSSMLNSKMNQMENLFQQLDVSGDNRLDRAELQTLLGKLHVHLNESEMNVVCARVGSDEKGNVGFVSFHKALLKTEHSAEVKFADFSRGIVLLGMPLKKNQIKAMYKRLITHGNGRIFFEKVMEELHELRDPIMKAILAKFDPKIQIKLKLYDVEGLFSIVSLREHDLKLLEQMKKEQGLEVLRRLEQTLRKDRSKSGRMTLSRLLGTVKSTEGTNANDPVKKFLGDYVATVFTLSGVRVSELFNKIDHSGDGFLTLDELENGFRRVSAENPDMVTEMTGAEMNILHDLMDQDGDGDLSFKELKYWLENSQDFRHITYRAFVMALKELGFGELRESMMKNIYVACVNDEKKGLIYFDRMYEILHQTDENGVPVAAKMNLSNGGSNGRKSKTISMGHVRVGLHKRDMKATDTGVPVWLGQLQFDPEAGRFKQQGATPKEAGLALKQVPLALRKVLKSFPLVLRRELTKLDEAGLVRVSELPPEAIRQLRDMDVKLALGVLERLYEKLIKERGRGHNAEDFLHGIFNLDNKKVEADKKRKAQKDRDRKGGKSKGVKGVKGSKTVGSMDGNTFARTYCMAALARCTDTVIASILPAIALVSRNGGDWQKKLQKQYPKKYAVLGLSFSQLSLLRWVLEGYSFDLIKLKRAVSILKKSGGIVEVELQHFVHAMNLLDVGLSDSVYENLYSAHGGDDGCVNLDTLTKGLSIATAQNENKSDLSKILAGVDDGDNWMDSMKSGSAPSWAMRGLPRMVGTVETAEEQRIEKRRAKAPTAAETKAMENIKRYRGSLDGPKAKISPRVQRAKLRGSRTQKNRNGAVLRPTYSGSTTFQGSLYPPRATDAMDDFSKASVKSGVSMRTANLTQGRAKRMLKTKNRK